MNAEDAEEYTQALGQVVAGGWRQIALGQRLGVPKALRLTVDEWVKNRLGGYVKYSVAERKEAVRTLAADGFSEREIKGAIGTGRKQVRQDLAGTPGTKHKQKLAAKRAERGTQDTKPLDVLTGLAATTAVRERAQRDEHRERLRTARPMPATPSGSYRLLYADPPWRYEHVETENRAIENQYPTMDLDAICALQVPAADDAVLFLWATSPKLAEAMRVLEAWRFDYRTCAVWDKEQIGMGYYFRQQHELLLVAARGMLPVPRPAIRPASVLHARRGLHSAKPTQVYVLLETMYPEFTDADRVELFCRTPRPGWAQWGNEPVKEVAS